MKEIFQRDTNSKQQNLHDTLHRKIREILGLKLMGIAVSNDVFGMEVVNLAAGLKKRF